MLPARPCQPTASQPPLAFACGPRKALVPDRIQLGLPALDEWPVEGSDKIKGSPQLEG